MHLLFEGSCARLPGVAVGGPRVGSSYHHVHNMRSVNVEGALHQQL